MRAKTLWNVDSAILVSQGFHLPRANWTCEQLGIESVGVSASIQTYVRDRAYRFRELLATYKAFFDVYVRTPDYLEREFEDDLVTPMPNKHPERILGFDPGYGRLGFGVLHRNERGELVYDTCGVITTLSEASMPERLHEIAQDLRTLISKHQPDLIALEELFFAQNTTTGLKVAEVRGVIQLLAAEAGVPCVEVKPVEVKMAVTGQGNADKRQMQKMITMLLRLDTIPSPDDAADALGVAWAGYAHRDRRSGGG